MFCIKLVVGLYVLTTETERVTDMINKWNSKTYETPRKPANTMFYRGADKSLARLWKETTCGDQDLQHYTKTYGAQTTGIYCCCLCAVSFGIVL